MPEINIIKGKVAAIINNHSVMINRGSKDGVQKGDRFKIYPKGAIATIKDPDDPNKKINIELYAPEVKVEIVIDDHFSLCKTEMISRFTYFDSPMLTPEILTSIQPLKDQVKPISEGDTVEQVVEPFEIIKAIYGAGDKTIDITTQLRNQIKNNRLIMDVSNKIAGDPAPGAKKKLHIEYRVYGRKQSVDYDEGVGFNLP